MAKEIRWGLVGLGNIAHTFVKDLQLVDDAVVYAAASRSADKAEEFAREHGIETAYGSYRELLEDDRVDIVYIATPHNSHAELTVAGLRNGRHILCEKPVAINREQAEGMVAASRESGKFFMEAFWARFNPNIREVIDRVRAGEIGEVRYVHADFAFRVDKDPSHRMLNMELGGGALLDMGVYPLFLAYAILGTPTGILAKSKFHATGADLQTAMILDYDKAQAVLYTGFSSQSEARATISGREGRVVIHPPWFAADSFTFFRNYDADGTLFEREKKGRGFCHEIEECHACIRSGRIESEHWSHGDSVELMGIVDRIRMMVGLRYPAE